jgi:hypothetical protein
MTISSGRWRYDKDLPAQFRPPASSPFTGATVDLDVSEIEDAGSREVFRAPRAAYGAWSILDAPLTPTGAGTPFIFRERLGQARELQVALSGLYGRLMARAISNTTSISRFSRISAAA